MNLFYAVKLFESWKSEVLKNGRYTYDKTKGILPAKKETVFWNREKIIDVTNIKYRKWLKSTFITKTAHCLYSWGNVSPRESCIITIMHMND